MSKPVLRHTVGVLLALVVVAPATLSVAAAKSAPATLTIKQERAVFRMWALSANTTAAQTRWNSEPNLGEDLGSTSYSAGTATAKSVFQFPTAAYFSLSSHYPQSFAVEDKVVITQNGSSTTYWQLETFTRSKPGKPWTSNMGTLLSSFVDLGKSGSSARPLTRANLRSLLASPAAAEAGVVQAANTEAQAGTSPALDPVPSFFSAIYQGSKPLLAAGYTYQSVASGASYPTYRFREPSGATLTLFTFQLDITAEVPVNTGDYYSSYMFPNQQISTEHDHWLFSVAVIDPEARHHGQLTIAGNEYGPVSATATNLSGQNLTFGPY